MTNYEKIISMPPRELAFWIMCPYGKDDGTVCDINCMDCCEKWLHEEAEETHDDARKTEECNGQTVHTVAVKDCMCCTLRAKGENRMSYKTCPLCGANLDPEEHCDCEKEKTARINAKGDPKKHYQYSTGTGKSQ